MRILHICPFRDYGRASTAGGKTISTWGLIQHQIAVGHEVFQLSLTDEQDSGQTPPDHLSKVKTFALSKLEGRWSNMFRMNWKHLIKLATQRSLREVLIVCRNANKVRLLIKEIKPDIIHLHYSNSWFPIAFRMCNIHIPLLTTCYAWHSLEHHISQENIYMEKRERYYSQTTIGLSDLVVLISEHNSTIAESIGLHFPKGFKVVHLPLPEGLTGVMNKNECKMKLSLPDQKIIVFCGLLKWQGRKRLDLLIKAVGDKEELRRNYIVVVIGNGDGRADYQKIADEMEVDCRFTGNINDHSLMSLYYNASDVFALPSDAEGWGVVYMEALYSGIPVIGYPFTMSALRQIVGDGVCEPFDTKHETSENLAEKLLRLSNLNCDREDLSKKIRDCFSGDVIHRRYDDIYRDLILKSMGEKYEKCSDCRWV